MCVCIYECKKYCKCILRLEKQTMKYERERGKREGEDFTQAMAVTFFEKTIEKTIQIQS